MVTHAAAPVDDSLLSAWLDRELEPAERARVDAWLREHPADVEKLRGWSADREALAARLQAVLEEPLPERLAQVVWQHAPEQAAAPLRARRIAGLAGLFVAGAVIGAAALWGMQRSGSVPPMLAAPAPEPAWVQRAALAYRVYAPEIRHPVEVNIATTPEAERTAQEQHLQRWLTKRVDVPVPLFDLRAQGFELVGGRLLPDGSKGPSAMLMYQHRDGTRVTVSIRQAGEAVPAAFRYERQADVGLFYWVEGRAGYALAGNLARERLLALAEAIYSQQQQQAAR
jgi:anti-sigma factor RsiW